MHILCKLACSSDEITIQVSRVSKGAELYSSQQKKLRDFGITCCRLVAALDEIELDSARKRKL